METRYLGNSGLKISAFILGNWLTHGAQIEDKAAEKCIRTALDHGIFTFDTADVYANGAAEKVLGRVLKDQDRQDLVIMTKVYWPVKHGGPNDEGLSRKHIMESIDNSMRRLKTDYVDVYHAHRFDYGTPLEETMVAFADLVRAGKVLYLGISDWDAEQIRQAAALARELRVPLISNQPQYSMLWRTPESEGIIQASEENGLSQICYSPLAQGVLTGKYQPGKTPKDKTRAASKGGAEMIQRWMRDDLLSAVQGLRRVAEEAGCKMNELALAWLLSRRNVSAAIIGASKPSQIEENLGALRVSLDDSILAAIDQVLGDFVVYQSPTPRSPLTRPSQA